MRRYLPFVMGLALLAATIGTGHVRSASGDAAGTPATSRSTAVVSASIDQPTGTFADAPAVRPDRGGHVAASADPTDVSVPTADPDPDQRGDLPVWSAWVSGSPRRAQIAVDTDAAPAGGIPRASDGPRAPPERRV